MQTSVITLLLIVILSLVFTIDAYPRRRISSDTLRERHSDYLGITAGEPVFNTRRKELVQNAVRRAIDAVFDGDNDDDYDGSYQDSYAKPIMRRKIVGLGDNPF